MTANLDPNAQVDLLLHKLADRRQTLGWRQSDLADKADVSRATVVRLETPGTSVSLLSAAQLAHAMGCQVVLSEPEADAADAEPAPLRHRGLYWTRVQARAEWPDQERERSMAHTWEQFNDPELLSSAILPSLLSPAGVTPTQDVATAVATVVQWLGSESGFGFLQAALAKAGYTVSKHSPA